MSGPGAVFGVPGGSLAGAGATFAKNEQVAALGAVGERKTAAILNELAARNGGPTVFHDLDIPLAGIRANVDHIVVSGNQLTIIDTKVWAGNLYWTLFGRTYRGLKRFSSRSRTGISYPAEKRTLPMARDAFANHLGISASQVKIALIVWPSGAKPLNLLFFTGAGNPRALDGSSLTVRSAKRLFGGSPASPALVAALHPLVK